MSPVSGSWLVDRANPVGGWTDRRIVSTDRNFIQASGVTSLVSGTRTPSHYIDLQETGLAQINADLARWRMQNECLELTAMWPLRQDDLLGALQPQDIVAIPELADESAAWRVVKRDRRLGRRPADRHRQRLRLAGLLQPGHRTGVSPVTSFDSKFGTLLNQARDARIAADRVLTVGVVERIHPQVDASGDPTGLALYDVRIFSRRGRPYILRHVASAVPVQARVRPDDTIQEGHEVFVTLVGGQHSRGAWITGLVQPPVPQLQADTVDVSPFGTYAGTSQVPTLPGTSPTGSSRSRTPSSSRPPACAWASA